MKQEIFEALNNLIYNPQKSSVQFSYLVNKQPKFFQYLLDIIQSQPLNQKLVSTGLIIFNKCLKQVLSYKNIALPKFLLLINDYWKTFQRLLYSQKIDFLFKRKFNSSFQELLNCINKNQIEKTLEKIKQKRREYSQNKSQIQYISILLQSLESCNICSFQKKSLLLSNIQYFSQQINLFIENLISNLHLKNKSFIEFLQVKQILSLYSLSNLQYFYQVLLKLLTFIIEEQSQLNQFQEMSSKQQCLGIGKIIASQSISNLVFKGIHLSSLLQITSDYQCSILSSFIQKNIDKIMKNIKVQSIKIFLLVCSSIPADNILQSSPFTIISQIPNFVQQILKQLYFFTNKFPKTLQNIQIWKQNANLISEMFQFLSQCCKFLQLRSIFQNLSEEFVFLVGICNMNLTSEIQYFQQQQDQDLKFFFQNSLKKHSQFDVSISIGKWLREMNKRIDGIQTFCFKICIELSLQKISSNSLLSENQILEESNIKGIVFQSTLLSYLNILTKLTIKQPLNQNIYPLIDRFFSKINLISFSRLQLSAFFIFLKNIVNMAFKNDQNFTSYMIKFANFALSKQVSPSVYSNLMFAESLILYLCQRLNQQNIRNQFQHQQIQKAFLNFLFDLMNNVLFNFSIYLLDTLQTILNHYYLRNSSIIEDILNQVYKKCIQKLYLQIKQQKQRNFCFILKLLSFLKFHLQYFQSVDWSQNKERTQIIENNIVNSTYKILYLFSQNSFTFSIQLKLQMIQFLNVFADCFYLLNNWNSLQRFSIIDLMIKALFNLNQKISPQFFSVLSKILLFKKGICLQSHQIDSVINESITVFQQKNQELISNSLDFLIYLYFFFIEYKFTFQKWNNYYLVLTDRFRKQRDLQYYSNSQIEIKILSLYILSLCQNRNISNTEIQIALKILQNRKKSFSLKHLIILLYATNYSKYKIPFAVLLIILRLILEQLDYPSKQQVLAYPFSNIDCYEKAKQIWKYLNQNKYFLQKEYSESLFYIENKIMSLKSKILVNGEVRTLIKIRKKYNPEKQFNEQLQI